MINIGLQHTVIFLTVIYQGFYISCQDNPNPSIKHEGYEYTLYSDLKSWTEAEDYCNSTEGHLVVIPNDEINEIVTNLIQGLDEEFVWIGAKRESTIPQWTWVNGSLVGMVGEDFLEPYNCNICNGRYGCGHIEIVITLSAKLVVVEDVTCSTPLRYICQHKECQENCKIQVYNETKSWNDAKAACISMGQELAVVPELEPNRSRGSNLQETLRTILGDDLPKDNIWIGVHRTDWKWINDEYVIYANKSDLRKKTDNWKNCLSMNKTGNWTPYDCSSSNKFVCSKFDSNTLKTSTEYETTKVTQETDKIFSEESETTKATSNSIDASIGKVSSQESETTKTTSNWIDANIGMVAGVVAGAAVLLVLIIAFVSILLCKKKQQNKTQQPIPLASNPNGTTPPSHAYETSIISPGMSTSTPSRPPAEGAEGPIYSEPDMNKKKHRESENVMVENDLYST